MSELLPSSGIDRRRSEQRRSGPRTISSVTSTSAGCERTPIPADKSRYGTFDILFEQSPKRRSAEIVEEARSAPEGSEARKVGDLYASFMDEERVEALGAEPLRADLARRRTAIASLDELLRVDRAAASARGSRGSSSVFVDNDPGNPERYLVFFEQGGISLPDESYYREEQFADGARGASSRTCERMFELAGVDDASARARRASSSSRPRSRKRHWDNVASRDSEKTYNLMSLGRACDDLFAAASPTSAGSGDSRRRGRAALRRAPGRLRRGRRARAELRRRARRALRRSAASTRGRTGCAWQVVRGYAPYLSRAFVDEHFDFYGRTLTGARRTARTLEARRVARRRARWAKSVGQIYVERHFPDDAKARMDELVANLIEAYRQSITDARVDGRGDAPARAREARGLHAEDRLSGSLARLRRTVASTPTTCSPTCARANAFEFDRQLAKIGQPIDRDEWFMTPQTVNAYYNPGFNEIVFPAAILQPPFFDADRDDAANYGAIGAVIGHEIGHGFDDQGSKFDGTGRLTDWWEPADREAFEERTEGAHRSVQRALARRRRPTARERRAHDWREHRRPRGTRHRLEGLSALAPGGRPAGHRRSHRRAALLPLVGSELAGTRSATEESSACSPSTRTRRPSSAATRSCATLTSSTTPLA